MKTIEDKRDFEKRLLAEMISLFCEKKHRIKDGLCGECEKLLLYAENRSDKCPFMETKTFCSNCTVHCYNPDMREQIRKVMRFSGPKMLLYHPVLAIKHVIESKKEKARIKHT